MSDVLLEYVVVDDMVRVAAVDGDTGTEAIIVGPVSAGRVALGNAATKKLDYIRAKMAKQSHTERRVRPGYWA